MLSPDKATALKSAGLLWEPYFGEWVFVEGERRMVVWVCEGEFGDYKDIRCLSPMTGVSKGITNLDCAWLPRLDQLLSEIERRKYLWNLDHTAGRYLCRIGEWHMRQCFWGYSPEDAAADALLYILKKGGE